MTRAGRRNDPAGAGAASAVPRDRLIALLERELAAPRPFETVAGDLPDLLQRDLGLGEALAALAEADRKRFWVKSQSLWFSRFGWRLIRPMMAAGLVGAAGFYFVAPEGSIGGYLYFLLGIAALYIALQIYAHLWSAKDEKKLAEAELNLAERLGRVLEDLRGTPR